ncbi:MAG: glycosyltransferase family 2 protein [Pikeienuella sp.]
MVQNKAPGAMETSVSVVIPFYRDEVYIEEAILSARAQRIDDLEIIVVNDNPSAESDAFLADIAARHPIRIARHEVNRGLSAARNTGIEAATKRFVAFLDADDVFTTNGLAASLKMAMASGADMTHAPSMVLYVRYLHSTMLSRDALLFCRDIADADLRRNPEAQFIVSSWSSLYRRDFLNAKQVRFDEAQRMYEDRLFVLEAVTKARKISFTSAPARIYRKRMGSITTSLKEERNIALQSELIVKCMAVAKAHVAAGGDPLFLLREACHSVNRLIWDVNFFSLDPAATPALDGVRARLAAAFDGVKLEKWIFGDKVLTPISRIGHGGPSQKPVDRKAFSAAFEMTRQGRWADLHQWRKSLDIPPAWWPRAKPRQLDAELVLHVGLHKTGTTHIQRMLEEDRARLAENGLLFPKTSFVGGVADNSRAAATPGHAPFHSSLLRRDLSLFAKLREEAAAAGAKRILISSENLSFPIQDADERRTAFAAAREAASIFSKVSVIAVIRRPDEYIERYYRELVFLAQPWARRSPDQFASEFAPLLTDLPALLGPWAELAGGDLKLISYEAARRDGLERAFYGAIGAHPPAAAGVRAPTYVSPTAAQVAAARVIATSRLNQTGQKAALGAFLSDTAGQPPEGRASLLSPWMRRQLIRRFDRASSGFMAAHGAPAPIDAWLADIGDEAPAAPDARMIERAVAAMERAVAAMERAAPARAAPTTPSPGLRLYRLAKAALARLT